MTSSRIPLGWIVAGVLGLVALGAAGWWLLSPLFINRVVNEPPPTPVASLATPFAPALPSQPEVPRPMASPTVLALITPTVAPTRALPTTLLQGVFYNVRYTGAGEARVEQGPDGVRYVRLQNFSVDNGPDLYVYLVPVDPVPGTSGRDIPGAYNLGQLKGNLGDQNYPLPAELDLSQYKSVVVWCQAFSVAFIAAPLASP